MKQMIEKLIKHKEISIIVIVLLSVFFIGRCSVPSVKQPKTDNQVPTHAHEKKAQWYTCSMHPQVRSNDPKGKCPICGMDLIPVAGGPHEHEEEEKVQLVLRLCLMFLLFPHNDKAFPMKSDSTDSLNMTREILLRSQLGLKAELMK